MSIKHTGFILAWIFSVAATPVMAENLYGAIDLGQVTGKDICTNNPPGVSGCEDTSTFFRFAFGSQFSPMWGVEASYASFGKASIGSLGGISGDWEATSLQVSGVGTFPIAEKFSITGKLGIASTDLKITTNISSGASETTTKLAWGIGAKYNFTETVSVRAQYEDFGTVGNDATTGTTKASLLSAGVIFKF